MRLFSVATIPAVFSSVLSGCAQLSVEKIRALKALAEIKEVTAALRNSPGTIPTKPPAPPPSAEELNERLKNAKATLTARHRLLEMAESGVLTKAGYKTNAAADAALSAINTSLDTVTKAKAELDKARAAAEASAATGAAGKLKDMNTAIAECLKSQAAVRDAGGTPVGSCQ